MADTGVPATKLRKRKGGMRQLLLQMKPDTIDRLKAAAADEDRHVYEIVQELVEEYLDQKSFGSPR